MRGLRERSRGLLGIGGAIALASIAGWALLSAVGHLLTPAEFGLFVAFWGVMFGLGGSLSTVEQETARRTAQRELTSPPTIGAVTLAAAGLAAVAGACTLVPAVAERLYGDGDSAIGLLVTLAAVGFALQFALRGSLVGSGRTGAYSVIVVAEAGARLAVLGVIALTVGVDLTTAAVAVAVGSFVWLGWPRRTRELLAVGRTRPVAWGRAGRRAVGLMVASALMAAMITGYPTMVTAFTGQVPGTAGGAVFAALTVSRVPLLLVSPVQALAVPAVVRWQADARAGRRAPGRSAVLLGTLVAAVLGALAGAVGWWLGPPVVQIVYGEDYVVPGDAVASLVLSSFLLAWLLLLSATLIALSAHRVVIAVWACATGATILFLLVTSSPVVYATALGALVGPVVGIAVAVPVVWRRIAAPEPSPRSAAPAAP